MPIPFLLAGLGALISGAGAAATAVGGAVAGAAGAASAAAAGAAAAATGAVGSAGAAIVAGASTVAGSASAAGAALSTGAGAVGGAASSAVAAATGAVGTASGSISAAVAAAEGAIMSGAASLAQGTLAKGLISTATNGLATAIEFSEGISIGVESTVIVAAGETELSSILIAEQLGGGLIAETVASAVAPIVGAIEGGGFALEVIGTNASFFAKGSGTMMDAWQTIGSIQAVSETAQMLSGYDIGAALTKRIEGIMESRFDELTGMAKFEEKVACLEEKITRRVATIEKNFTEQLELNADEVEAMLPKVVGKAAHDIFRSTFKV